MNAARDKVNSAYAVEMGDAAGAPAGLSESWEAARQGGRLVLWAIREIVNHTDVANAARWLAESRVCRGVRELVFDLGRVESFGDQWTLVLAEFVRLARQTGIPCRVAALHGQPAAAAAMYRGNREVMALFEGRAA